MRSRPTLQVESIPPWMQADCGTASSAVGEAECWYGGRRRGLNVIAGCPARTYFLLCAIALLLAGALGMTLMYLVL